MRITFVSCLYYEFNSLKNDGKFFFGKLFLDKILGCSKSFESGNENTFFFGEITFIAQYNLP